MISIFRKVDEALIMAFQEAYLWLLDRTGIYVATIGLLLFAGSVCLIRWNEVPISITCIVIVIGAANMLILGHKYNLQGKGDDKTFNFLAITFIERFLWRWFLNVQMLVFTAFSIIEMDGRALIVDILILTYNYVSCLMIRDRDKKPFWETKTEAVLEGT